jgi:hypothetical protein
MSEYQLSTRSTTAILTVPTDLLIHGRRRPRHGLQHRIRTERVKVGSGVIERTMFSHVDQVEIRIEVEFSRQGGQDVVLCFVVLTDAQVEHSIKPAEPR